MKLKDTGARGPKNRLCINIYWFRMLYAGYIEWYTLTSRLLGCINYNSPWIKI